MKTMLQLFFPNVKGGWNKSVAGRRTRPPDPGLPSENPPIFLYLEASEAQFLSLIDHLSVFVQ